MENLGDGQGMLADVEGEELPECLEAGVFNDRISVYLLTFVLLCHIWYYYFGYSKSLKTILNNYLITTFLMHRT